MTNKTLSDDIVDILYEANGTGSGSDDVCKFIQKRDKEFIKELKEDLDTKPHWTKENYEFMIRKHLEKIDKLAGKGLK